SDPYRIAVKLDDWKVRKSGYTLLFNNLLGYLDSRGLLNNFIERVRHDEASGHLMAHLILLFGSLSYYAGLLARKVEPARATCHIYFCGKGGKLVEWIPR